MFCLEINNLVLMDTDSVPPAPLWTLGGRHLCGTACSHWGVGCTQTLVSGMSCHVCQSVCTRVSV